MSKKDAEWRCELCEKPLCKQKFFGIETKANGTLEVCERCAKWIRDHRFAA